MTQYRIGDTVILKDGVLSNTNGNVVPIAWINTDGLGMFWYTVSDDDGYEFSVTDDDIISKAEENE